MLSGLRIFGQKASLGLNKQVLTKNSYRELSRDSYEHFFSTKVLTISDILKQKQFLAICCLQIWFQILNDETHTFITFKTDYCELFVRVFFQLGPKARYINLIPIRWISAFCFLAKTFPQMWHSRNLWISMWAKKKVDKSQKFFQFLSHLHKKPWKSLSISKPGIHLVNFRVIFFRSQPKYLFGFQTWDSLLVSILFFLSNCINFRVFSAISDC